MNTEHVNPARLADGHWNPTTQEQEKEGDIAASYSAERIAEGKPIRKPFKHNGVLWCAVGSARKHREGRAAYRIVPLAEFDGTPTKYGEKFAGDWEQCRNDSLGFYHGMTVKHGGKVCVLRGPETEFLPLEAQQEPPRTAHQPDLISTIEGNTAGVAQADPETPPDNSLPPVDHSQGFRTNAEIRTYLAAFADRPGEEVASFDLWGRPTTFDDLRQLVAGRQETRSFSFMEEETA